METFVLRVWKPAHGVTDAHSSALRGVVEHVPTAASCSFTAEDELVRFLRGALASSERAPGAMSSWSSNLAEGRTP
jgi:hypothetical protein